VRTETTNWLKGVDYDLESARYMLSSRRYLYVVFLCHLALEKNAQGPRFGSNTISSTAKPRPGLSGYLKKTEDVIKWLKQRPELNE
jgi:hypothetical protein